MSTSPVPRQYPRLNPARFVVDPRMVAVAGFEFAKDRVTSVHCPGTEEADSSFQRGYNEVVRTLKAAEKMVTKVPKDAWGLAEASDSDLVTIVVRARDDNQPTHYVLLPPKDVAVYLRCLSRAAMAAGEETLSVELGELSGLIQGNYGDAALNRVHFILGLEAWRAGA